MTRHVSIDLQETLDPADWDATRTLAHRMVDDAIDRLRDVRDRPVWQIGIARNRGSSSSGSRHSPG